ncbi:MAG: hypothetical protein M3R61_17740, partial [Chloroflexota bacterium]|nr:hypothetical protein [Chloroflexota bacterium]
MRIASTSTYYTQLGESLKSKKCAVAGSHPNPAPIAMGVVSPGSDGMTILHRTPKSTITMPVGAILVIAHNAI